MLMLFLCVLRVLCGESVFFRAENKFTLEPRGYAEAAGGKICPNLRVPGFRNAETMPHVCGKRNRVAPDP